MEFLNVVVELIKALAWPVVVLFLAARFTPALTNILSLLSGYLQSIKRVKLNIFGQEIELSDFQKILEKEVVNLENTLADIFPPEKSSRYMPLMAEPKIAYYVHAVEFLDTIKVDIKNSTAWNAVGHYYFPTDKEKSRKCYEKAIYLMKLLNGIKLIFGLTMA